MFFTLGIDVGCSAVKASLMQFDPAGGGPKLLTCEGEKIRKRNVKDVIGDCYEKVLAKQGVKAGDVAYVASTGEGELVDFRRGHFYSMTCHSRGGLFLAPQVRAVVDMGALHAKAITMDEHARVLAYRMTSQCASGSGQFLENIARYLGVATEDIGQLSLTAKQPETVSGICAVLAETDVINMVSRGIATNDIIKGIHLSMARRLVSLLRVLKAEGDVLATGGLAQDAGLVAAMQELAEKDKMAVRFIADPLSPFAGAIGAALWAAVRHVKLRGTPRSSSEARA